MTFNLFPTTNKEIRDLIQVCQKMNHVQQVAYSTYHDCLTQICFNCKMIRTSMKAEGYHTSEYTKSKKG